MNLLLCSWNIFSLYSQRYGAYFSNAHLLKPFQLVNKISFLYYPGVKELPSEQLQVGLTPGPQGLAGLFSTRLNNFRFISDFDGTLEKYNFVSNIFSIRIVNMIFLFAITWTCLPSWQVQVLGRTQSSHGPFPVLSRLLGRTTPVYHVLVGLAKIPGCEAAAVGAAAGGRPVAGSAGAPGNIQFFNFPT